MMKFDYIYVKKCSMPIVRCGEGSEILLIVGAACQYPNYRQIKKTVKVWSLDHT
jgi:hypothetical protein